MMKFREKQSSILKLGRSFVKSWKSSTKSSDMTKQPFHKQNIKKISFISSHLFQAYLSDPVMRLSHFILIPLYCHFFKSSR